MTSAADLDRQLRQAMRPDPSDLEVAPSFVAQVVSRSTQSRRRRRITYAVGVPLLAAAVAAAIVVVATREADTDPAPVERPDSQVPLPLGAWLENPPLNPAIGDPSKPALPGTAMYRSCDGDDCAVTLVSPSGREIDLADVSPDVAEILAEDGLTDASLSPTGRWLGMPRDGAYRIYDLAHPGSTIDVPASPDGDRWELVGWSEQSWAPTLALYEGDRIARFANWDNLGRDGVGYLDVPDGVVTTPFIGHRPYVSPAAEPYEPADGVMPRIASTTSPTNEWFIVRRLYGKFTGGKVFDSSELDEGYTGQSFESCVGPDETLAAPDGRIYEWEMRGSRMVHADIVAVATAIFSRDVSHTEPVAMVVWNCEPREPFGSPSYERRLPNGGRLDLPTSTGSDEWTFLGMLADGEVAMLHSTADRQAYVQLSEDGELDPMHDLPADAEVITPGGVAGD